MSLDPRIRRAVATTVALCFGAVALAMFFFRPEAQPNWWIAFGTLLALSLISTLMALQVGEGGTTSSLEFIPQLAAVMLLGPVGAAGIAFLSELFSTLFAGRKAVHKRLFNVAQMTLAITAAALAYRTFGGTVSLESFEVTQVVAPFLLAVVVYFLVNTSLVSYVVAEAQGLALLLQQRGAR